MKYAIYPYSNHMLPILQYIEKNQPCLNRFQSTRISEKGNTRISYLIYPRGWSKKINLVSGYNTSTDLCAALEDVDGVIFLDISEWSYLYLEVKRNIQLALEQKKSVICCTKLEDSDLLLFSNAENFVYLEDSINKYSEMDLSPYQIQDVPVVCIGNIFRGMDTTAIIVEIDKFFQEKGYTTLVIGANRNGLLVGHRFLSEDVFRQYPYEDSVKRINAFINLMQREKRADIILLQLDDAMLRYSGICGEGYGVKNYIVSQAIVVDYFIFHTVFTDIDPDGMKALSELFYYRYGCRIDALVFSHLTVNDSSTIEDNSVVFSTVPKDLAGECIESWKEAQNDILCADITKQEDLCKIACQIHKILTIGVDAV